MNDNHIFYEDLFLGLAYSGSPIPRQRVGHHSTDGVELLEPLRLQHQRVHCEGNSIIVDQNWVGRQRVQIYQY